MREEGLGKQGRRGGGKEQSVREEGKRVLNKEKKECSGKRGKVLREERKE